METHMSTATKKIVQVPDGKGGFRLELQPAPAPAKKGKADRPDPIQTQTVVKSESGEVVAADLLRQLLERLERQFEEKASIMEDISETLAEAKAQGFDVPTIRELLKARRMEKHKLQEKNALLETYMAALGMLDA